MTHSQDLHRPTLHLLLINAALLTLPHVQNLSSPIIALVLSLLAWRWLALRNSRWLPGRPLLLLMTFVLAFVIVRAHGVSLGRDASSSLLLVLMALKLLELRRDRDVLVAIFLGFFLLITPFLFEQTIPIALYSLAVFVLLLSTLVSHNTRPTSIKQAHIWRLSIGLSLQAIPLMLALFLLFPRIVGPLWALPDDANQGYSGISDTLSPGSISNLSLLDDTAFRVTFNGPIPPQPALYWRGPVYWTTNGRDWSHHARLAQFPSTKITSSGKGSSKTYDYSLIMEPHQQRWLYALDRPVIAPEGARLSTDHQLILPRKLNRTRQLQIRSQSKIEDQTLNDLDRYRGLELPNDTDPRIYELSQQWRDQAKSDEDVVRFALRHFREQPFVYTLKPPLLGNNPVGEFLFDTRRGFCSHYATSFTVLMRSAGIPARLVGGYQGGIYNELGGFLEVRQADAHVWSEVWLESGGWTRVDPTAAVSPQRIEHSIDLASQLDSGDVRYLLQPPEGLTRWLQNGRQLWLTLDHLWEGAVLAYGPENQRDFLAGFGIVDWQGMIKALAISVALILILLAVFVLRTGTWHRDPVQRAYLKFCRKLGKLTVHRKPYETATDYSNRITKQYPNLSTGIREIAQAYLESRYGKAGHESLALRIKHFHWPH